MNQDIERLFPFVKKAKILLVGRERLKRSKSHLHFILITEDIAENSKNEIIRDFKHYPIVQCLSSEYIDTHFELRNTKFIGFKKSGLSSSIYQELKSWRINGNTQAL